MLIHLQHATTFPKHTITIPHCLITYICICWLVNSDESFGYDGMGKNELKRKKPCYYKPYEYNLNYTMMTTLSHNLTFVAYFFRLLEHSIYILIDYGHDISLNLKNVWEWSKNPNIIMGSANTYSICHNLVNRIQSHRYSMMYHTFSQAFYLSHVTTSLHL